MQVEILYNHKTRYYYLAARCWQDMTSLTSQSYSLPDMLTSVLITVPKLLVDILCFFVITSINDVHKYDARLLMNLVRLHVLREPPSMSILLTLHNHSSYFYYLFEKCCTSPPTFPPMDDHCATDKTLDTVIMRSQ